MLSLTIFIAVLSLTSLSSAKECPKIVTQNPFDITQVSVVVFSLLVLENSIDLVSWALV